jgi:Tfp pilus assembly protein PilN
MIKVNLLRDIANPDAGQVYESNYLASESTGDINNFDIGVKITLFVVPLLLMFGYRQFLVSRAEAQHVKLLREHAEADTKLKGYDAALRDIERFEEEKKRLNSELDVIKALSKERLKIVKSLDAMQTIIPNSAWLSSLKIKSDKVEIEGYAVNDVVVSEFMQLLSSSIYFSHVILSDSAEASTPEGAVKKFSIKCSLEKI